ncbi:recombinase family protein [Herbivorax sp. ANBcel31]|uniref:recombinase family protein n=1 Tax=Herbivorax sp. ANBcel31 TaxID=3069754 RepID=UPI0027B1CAF0|nr:recombinase family protein [Herbivorax sp. ANBcel31]MDQ2087681.1 recombinase family protein [Herbivorax sp. ANBcel31]
MTDKIEYIPPLVSCNNLSSLVDPHKTIGKIGLNVGGYIRVSTKKEAQLTSIENQKKILNEWAKINGYNLLNFYIDIKSGSFSYLRNEMQQLKQDIKSGLIKGIIAKEIARTSRDIMDILDLKRSLESDGAFFISLKENYDSRVDDDEFLLIIYAALAQKERKTTAGRVKVTQMLKAREGKTNVGSPAYGYKLSPNKQHLVIDFEKAKIYRLIVEKFLDGWGQLKISKWLNQKKIPSKRVKTWHTNTIKAILTNPVYLGITIYNATTLIRDSSGKQKRVVRPQEEWIVRHNTHKPLIAFEEYNQIIDKFKTRKKKFCKEWTGEKKYLLSGLLYCNICNGKIYGGKQTSYNKTKNFYYYVDQNRYGICDTKTKYWNMEKVNGLIISKIKSFFNDRELIHKIIEKKYLNLNQNISDDNLKHLELNLKSILIAIKKQQEAYEKDIISIEEYNIRMQELRNRKKEFIDKIDLANKINNSSFDSDKKFEFIKYKVFNIIENLDNADYDIKEFIVKKIIKRVEISSDYSIKIDYTFD